jgi:hypothetical protein
MEVYTDIVLNNPLSSLRNIYNNYPNKIIQKISNELLLLHGIIFLLPEEITLYILSFLFDEPKCIHLYYKEYSLSDALTLYQAVIEHELECLFLYPEKTKFIMNKKDATYVTFEEYQAINDVEQDMINLIGKSYVLPPITFIKHNVKCLLIVNAIIFSIITAIVIGIVILYLYGISIKAVIIITPPLYGFFLFICICTSYSMMYDIYKRSTQIENYQPL